MKKINDIKMFPAIQKGIFRHSRVILEHFSGGKPPDPEGFLDEVNAYIFSIFLAFV